MSELYIFNTSSKDYEFIGFTFNGHHSSEYGLTSVVSGFKQDSLFSNFEDRTMEVPGRDGAYYFGTRVGTKSLPITLAFDNLTSANKKSILKWLDPKTVGKLTFDEAPYKYYYVKIAGPPTFSFVPFENSIALGKQHIFKGTLEFEFLALDPYGYSDYAIISQVPIWNGSVLTNYSDYPENTTYFYDASHLPGWYGESGLHDVAPNPDTLAYANDSDGYTVASVSIGNFAKNFYNGGDLEDVVEFTVYVAAFAIGSSLSLTMTPTSPYVAQTLTIASLKNITALASNTGTWKIVCTPKTGSIIGYVSTDNYATPYYLGALHNGVFLKACPGNNTLSTNLALTNPIIKYKYKYW